MSGSKSCRQPSSSPATAATSGAPGVASVSDPEIKLLIRKAETGDLKAYLALKDKFRGRLGELFDRRLGEPAKLVRHVLCHSFGGKENLMAGETFEQTAKRLQASLIGDCTDPLVKLAAELVTVCWLDVYAKYGETMGGGNIALEMHREKRLNAATRRLATAVGMLDKLRRVDLSGLLTVMGSGNAIQVNLDASGKPSVKPVPAIDDPDA